MCAIFLSISATESLCKGTPQRQEEIQIYASKEGCWSNMQTLIKDKIRINLKEFKYGREQQL